MSEAATKERPSKVAAEADRASADEILVGYEGVARLTKYTVSTLRKKRQGLPAPHINDLDARGRPHRVLWLREKIVAWVEAGMPADVAAFDAKWKKGRKG